MGRAARDPEPEGQCAGVRDHDVAARGFGDDRCLAGVAAQHGGERSHPAVLLADDGVQGDGRSRVTPEATTVPNGSVPILVDRYRTEGEATHDVTARLAC